MSKTYIPAAVRRHVIERAFHRCEYCLLPEDFALYSFHVDHIIPEKQGGATSAGNLALSCRTCNISKGDSVVAYRLEWDDTIRLYNPRNQNWIDHFLLRKDGMISWKTDIGVATIRILKFNETLRIQRRKLLYNQGIYNI